MTAPQTPIAQIGAVLIGRNEGVRLERALDAVITNVGRVVYVDSGSTDNSVANAISAGAEVVQLDMTQPFTAARARNAGLARLNQIAAPTYVQFIDGDCAVYPNWILTAADFLDTHPDVAVVCGRRREIAPDASLYNRIIDKEWNTPVGEARACGGDALMRVAVLQDVGGYNPTLIAGEEPELCVRIRAAGAKVWRLDADMTDHDADITQFDQWWTRTRRAGHAFAEGAALHGAPPERHWVTETKRVLIWGAGIPLAILLLAILVSPWVLIGLGIYPLQALRLGRRDGDMVDALFLTIGKFAQAQGAIGYYWSRIRHKRARLIEYK
jgi:glycosyltransferase involved in cell wall biosynthesis